MHGTREVAIPVLTMLAKIEGVQEIRAGAAYAEIGNRAEVRNGDMLFRRLGEKEESHWRMGSPGERLELFERRASVAQLPLFELRKAAHQRVDAVPGAFTRPAQQIGLNGDTVHGLILPGVRAIGKHQFSVRDSSRTVR